MRPTIGITTYHTFADWRGWREEGALLPWTYVKSIRDSGGTLHQHVPDLVGHEVHSGPADGFGRHKVRVIAGELLRGILPGGEYFDVPTHHHQAVDEVGAGLTAVGWADDGIIEAVESDSVEQFLIGVQWHPEQGDDLRLFSALVAAADIHSSEREVASLPSLLADA